MNKSFSSFLDRSAAAPAHPDRKTKIVATIGPACESEQQIEALLRAGVDVFRFNTKHNVPAWHLERVMRVKKISQATMIPVAILLDLQGPEVRVTLTNQESFALEKDEGVVFASAELPSVAKHIIIPQLVIDSLPVGQTIILSDGDCELTVTAKTETTLSAKAVEACTIKTRKTLSVPGFTLNMPSLLPQDLAYLDAVEEVGVEFVGLSFVRSAADIANLGMELKKRNLQADIIAKIENRAAIEHLEEIVAAADAVMIARGDMGVELPFYEFPHWQRVIIEACRRARVPSITATQMLISMVSSPRPSRAEVSDVAHAVYDGTDAVMLSEETAIGINPARVVEVQAKILAYHDQFV